MDRETRLALAEMRKASSSSAPLAACLGDLGASLGGARAGAAAAAEGVLSREGCVWVTDLVGSLQACSDALREITRQEEAFLSRGDLPPSAIQSHTGDIHGGSSDLAATMYNAKRLDLKLALTPPLLDFVQQHLFSPALCGLVLDYSDGLEAACVAELACMTAFPGASRQPLHADTSWFCGKTAVTVFVCLEDVLDAPTLLLVSTHRQGGLHTGEAQLDLEARLAGEAGGGGLGAEGSPYRTRPVLAWLRRGSGLVMDSRLLHCGTRHEGNAEGPRRLLYATVNLSQKDTLPGSTNTLREELARTLLITRRGLVVAS